LQPYGENCQESSDWPVLQIFKNELRNQYHYLSEVETQARMNIISIGEVLWDLFPDGPRIGGAPFNFAVHMRRLGHDVHFVSAVGDDALGRDALEAMRQQGLRTTNIEITPDLPTGTVTVELSCGEPRFTINTPAAYQHISAQEIDIAADWIYFGTLAQAAAPTLSTLRHLASQNPGARLFYDMNLRPNCWTREVVRELLSMADLVKVNEHEASTIDTTGKDRVCITRGKRGCTLRFDSFSVEVPGVPVNVADTVGAGDAWAAAFLHAYSAGQPLRRAGEFANRLGGLVASRPGGVPDWSLSELR
jgi:fructokinase